MDISSETMYGVHLMTNKDIAEQIIRGKRKFVRVPTLRRATAIRVAGHRLGSVLTAQRVKGGWRLVKSDAKVSHRRKASPRARSKAR